MLFYILEGKMELFDVTKYQLPAESAVEWETTKERLGIFLSQYKSVREKLGISAAPKIYETYSFLHHEDIPRQLMGDPMNIFIEYLSRGIWLSITRTNLKLLIEEGNFFY